MTLDELTKNLNVFQDRHTFSSPKQGKPILKNLNRDSDKTQKYITVSMHDMTPKYKRESIEILKILKSNGIDKVNSLVVPNWNLEHDIEKDLEFVETIKSLEASGSEILLHGYSHTAPPGSYNTMRSFLLATLRDIHFSEFEVLNFEKANKKIQKGIDKLLSIGISPKGFVSPCWGTSYESIEALRENGFDYISLRDQLLSLEDYSTVPTQILELCSSNRVIDIFSRAYNEAVSRYSLRDIELIRVPLHHDDIEGSKPIYQAMSIIDRLRSEGRKLVTFSEYLSVNQSANYNKNI